MGLVSVKKEQGAFLCLEYGTADMYLGFTFQYQRDLQRPVHMGVPVNDLDDIGPHMVELGIGNDLVFFFGYSVGSQTEHLLKNTR